jgi:hypothetical protein
MAAYVKRCRCEKFLSYLQVKFDKFHIDGIRDGYDFFKELNKKLKPVIKAYNIPLENEFEPDEHIKRHGISRESMPYLNTVLSGNRPNGNRVPPCLNLEIRNLVQEYLKNHKKFRQIFVEKEAVRQLDDLDLKVRKRELEVNQYISMLEGIISPFVSSISIYSTDGGLDLNIEDEDSELTDKLRVISKADDMLNNIETPQEPDGISNALTQTRLLATLMDRRVGLPTHVSESKKLLAFLYGGSPLIARVIDSLGYAEHTFSLSSKKVEISPGQ